MAHSWSYGSVGTAGGGTTATVSPNYPTGISAGDLLIAVVATQSGNTPSHSGWTALGSVNESTTPVKTFFYGKIAVGTESGSTSFGGLLNSFPNLAFIFNVLGTNLSIEDIQSTANGASTVTHTTPSATSATPDACVIRIVTSTNNTSSHTWPAGTTEVIDISNNFGCSVGIDDNGPTPAGATGTVVATASAARRWTAATLVFPNLTTTTQVSSTTTLKWDIQNQVSASRALKYDMLNQVASTRALKYDMLNQVAGTRKLVYGINAQVAGTRTLKWDLVNQVSSTRSLKWDMLNQVAGTRKLVWSMLNQVAGTRKLVYGINAQVSATRKLVYDIIAAGQISNQRILVWDFTPRVSNQRTLVWEIVKQVSTTATLKWDILDRVRNGVTLKWDILKQVSATRQLVWSIVFFVARQRRLRWHIGDPPAGGFPADRGDDSNLRERDGIRHPTVPFVG